MCIRDRCVATLPCEMSDIALKPATTLAYCVRPINVEQTWTVAPKQPGLKSGRFFCWGGSSTNGLSTSTIYDNQPAEAGDRHWVGQLLSQRLADRSIGQWRRRLECVVQQQSGLIEHLIWKLQDVHHHHLFASKSITQCTRLTQKYSWRDIPGSWSTYSSLPKLNTQTRE